MTRSLKLDFKINKVSTTSRTQIIERKLNHLRLSKMKDALESVRKYSLVILRSRERLAHLLTHMNQMILRKNSMYGVFYMLKFKRRDIGSLEFSKPKPTT